MHKKIYLWNTIFFLILLATSLIFLMNNPFIRLPINLIGIYFLLLILHLLVFLLLIFKTNFSNKSNLISITFNWLSILSIPVAIFSGYFSYISLILSGIFSFISLVTSIIFYFRNK